MLSILPTLGFFGGMLWLMGAPWREIALFSSLLALPGTVAIAFRSHRVAIGRPLHIEDGAPGQFQFESPPAPTWSTDIDFPEVRATRGSRVSGPVAAFSLAAAMFLMFATTGLGLIAFMAAGYVGHKLFVGRKRAALSYHSLAVTSNELAEIDADGRVLSKLDLSQPLTYVYLDKEEGTAVYRVNQGRVRVEFLSSTPGADIVVQRILGADWPPRDTARAGA